LVIARLGLMPPAFPASSLLKVPGRKKESMKLNLRFVTLPTLAALLGLPFPVVGSLGLPPG